MLGPRGSEFWRLKCSKKHGRASVWSTLVLQNSRLLTKKHGRASVLSTLSQNGARMVPNVLPNGAKIDAARMQASAQFAAKMQGLAQLQEGANSS